MIDTRINEKRAKELLKSKTKLVFRYVINDKELVERSIIPIKDIKQGYIYRDSKITYSPKDGTKVSIDSNKNKLYQYKREEYSCNKYCILNRVVELLNMGYILIGGDS